MHVPSFSADTASAANAIDATRLAPWLATGVVATAAGLLWGAALAAGGPGRIALAAIQL